MHGQSRIKIFYLSICWNSVEKIQVWLKSDKSNRYLLYMKMFVHLWQYHTEFLEWELFQKKLKCCRENQSTHFIYTSLIQQMHQPFKTLHSQ
jgi:hypothetical protein